LNRAYATGLTRPEALVFDLDGTLWDAAEATARGWNLALESLGLAARVDLAGIRSVCGRPFQQCVERLLPELRPASAVLLEALDEHERAAVESRGGALYEGVAAGLRRLAERYRLFLVSNCPAWYLAAFLEISGLRGCFSGWWCHGSSGLSKTEMLRSLCEEHGLTHALYVGDTRGDEEAARQAGMGFVFVAYGFGDADAPDLVFDGFGALTRHFLS